jgi:hypothetical protein
MSQQSQQIVIISGNPLNAAIAAVIPLFIDTEVVSLSPAQLTAQPKIPTRAILILNDTQIAHLPNLRLHGFAGAVLSIATNPHHNPSQKHRILRWGQDSHATFTTPYSLPELLDSIANLVPLEPENLKMLQTELTAPKRWFQSRIIPALKELTQDPTDTSKIAQIVSEIRAKTPVACHASIEIAGETAQIQQHFTYILKDLSSSPLSPDRTNDLLGRLRQTFDRWREIAISGGEGLGTFT